LSPGAWLALGLLALGLILPMLAWPFGRDQGNYAYPAWRLLEGDRPYADVYVFKPPGTLLLHALAQLVFGHHMAAIRALDGLLTLSATGSLAVLARRFGGSDAVAVTGGLVFVALHTGAGHWHTAQTDPWFAPFFLFAVVLVTGRRLSWPQGALAGASLGFMVLLKYTALGYGLPLALAAAAARPRAPLRAWAGPALAGLGGLLAVVLAQVGWLVALGAWPAFLDAQRLVASYATQAPRWDFQYWSSNLLFLLWWFPSVRWWLVLVPAGIYALAKTGWGRPDQRGLVLALLSLGAVALASIVSQGRYFLYHYQVLVPLMALAGAWLSHTLSGALAARTGRRPEALQAVLALGLDALTFAGRGQDWRTAARWLAEGDRAHQSMIAFGTQQPIGWFLDAADWLRAETRPEDPVFVFGYDPVVLFLAERKQVSKFLYSYPLLVTEVDHPVVEELHAALRAEPPVVVALARKDTARHVTGTAQDSLGAWYDRPDLRAFTEAGYQRVEALEGFEVWRRRAPDQPPP
jgi:hypothetical protein